MKKALIASALGLACVMPFSSANASCGWSGQRGGLVSSGAIIGTLVAGPVGTVVGAAVGDWLNGSTDDCHIKKATLSSKTTPEDTYGKLAPFNNGGEVSIYFSTASSALQLHDTNKLNKVADLLKSNDELNLAVVGGSDPRAKNNYNNLALSQRRANSIKQYLTSKEGINSNRIFTKGIGASQPTNNETYSKLRVAKLRLVKVVK